MIRTRLLIIVLILIAIVLVLIAVLGARKQKIEQPAVPTPTPISPLLPLHRASPTKQVVPTGSSVLVDNVSVNNFYSTSQPIDPQGDRTLTESDGYRITYLAGDKQFLIIITGSGFDANRHAAEQQFLTALGVSQSDACKLNVVERTISSANPDQAGQDYSLSFCGNEATNSTTPTAQPTPEKITIYRTAQSLDLTIGTPQGSTTLGKTCNPSSSCVQGLKDNGILLGGDLSLNGDPYGKAKLVYETLSLVTQPPSHYGSLLGLPAKQVTITFSGGGCAGHASQTGQVILYGFGACGTDVAKFILIHELAHEIAFRNSNLYNEFLNISPSQRDTLPTYNCQLDYGPGPWPAECWADGIGEYVTYSYFRLTVSGKPPYFESTFASYPSRFPTLYNFIKTNIFNGLQF